MNLVDVKNLKGLKILLIDIETTPNLVWAWRTGYNLTISPESIHKERQIIMVSYKWLGDKKVHRITWSPKTQDERSMLKKIAKVFDQAKVVIGHNGDRFDIPWLKTRTLMLDLPPLNNVISLDTLKLARSNFYLNSNKLDYIAKALGIGSKIKTGYDLWLKVMSGDKKALVQMGKYCDNDVKLLEKVLLKLLPHVKNIPVSFNLLKDTLIDISECQVCGKPSTKNGFKYTKTGKYQAYICSDKNCLSRHRGTKNLKIRE